MSRIIVAGRVYRMESQFEGTELHVFDFDGTLFKSPEKPSWWPHRSWWSNAESLLPPCVPEEPSASWWVSDVVSQAKKSIRSDEAYTLMLTARVQDAFDDRITDLLHQKDLLFDELRFKHAAHENTPKYKARHIRSVADKFPELTEIHIWDDSPNNLETVQQELEDVGYEVVLHGVKSETRDVDCSEAEYEKSREGED
jgi:hypothetical protein